jgi:putative transposase
MARLARIVIPGLPHHVTQRGNRREAIFFEDGDHEIYLDLLAEQTSKADVAVWAYCLMPNHVHLILKPTRSDDLGRAVGEPTGATPTSSTPADAGPATCFRAALPRSCWTMRI